MFAFRSLALGLLGACCLLLAARPPVTVITHTPAFAFAEPRTPWCSSHVPRAPTIIDVAPGASAADIARLVVLEPGERITAIDDAPVAGGLDAGVALASSELGGRRYIDLEVAGDAGTRRVLVLLH